MFVRGEATILHADLDAFYASVEQRDAPRLRGRPVIVGGGVVLACSYEAKRRGVRTAMNGRQAGRSARRRSWCRRGCTPTPRRARPCSRSSATPRRSSRASRSTRRSSRSAGCARSRAAGGDRRASCGRGWPPRSGCRSRSGSRARSSWPRSPAGSPSPTACCSCRRDGERAFLHPLPVERLWGVGKVTSAKLHALGVRTVAEVAALGEAGLVSVVGRAAGRHLNALASGLDPRPVDTARRRRSIGSQQALGRRARSDRGARRDPGGHSSTGSAAACAKATARRAPWCCGCASTTSRAPPARTRWPRPPRTPPPCWRPRRVLLRGALPMIHERGITLLGISLSGLDDDRAPSSRSRSTCGAGPPSTARSMRCSSDSAADRSAGPPSCACVLPWKSPDWTISDAKMRVDPAGDDVRSGTRRGAQPHPRPDRPAAVVAVPHPDGGRARRRLGPRRAGDHRRQRRRRDVLTEPETLGLSSTAVGLVATVYLLGEVVGALFFGRLSDRLGRRNLFIDHARRLPGRQRADRADAGQRPRLARSSSTLTRFIAGMGIGGEYAAINSAIDELIPAAVPRPRRHRGQRHLLGRRDPRHARQPTSCSTCSSPSSGWRIGFLIGPVLGLVILVVRRHLPESPRWQVMHGREDEAEETIAYIEHEVEESGARAADGRREQGHRDPAGARRSATSRWPGCCSSEYPTRSILGATLMITQSFLYNAIFFTYTLVLAKFYGVDVGAAPLFLIAFAVGNLVGPAHARAPVRHDRPPEDDRRHLHPVRRAAGDHRRSCSTPACSTRSPRPSPGASSSSSPRPARAPRT